MSSPEFPSNSADPPKGRHTSPITLTAPDSMYPANQTLPEHEEHRGCRGTSIEFGSGTPPDITQVATTLHERRIDKRVLENRKKMHEQMEDDIEEDEMPEPSTSPKKSISEMWREQQRLLEAKHQQTQAKSSSAAFAHNISTSSTRRGYTANLPKIYDSLPTTTPSPKTDTENYAPPSLVMEWVEQELAELRLGTYSPAVAAEMDEHENEIGGEGLPVEPLARLLALNKMKGEIHRRAESKEREEEMDKEEHEEEEEKEEEEEEEEEDSLTFAAFDRKLRMKAAVWEIQRREKRSSDSAANQEVDSNKLRFGAPKAGMQSVMEERARRKRAPAATKAAMEVAASEDQTSNKPLSIKDPDPIRGMQMVMEERARRRRAKAATEETAALDYKPTASSSSRPESTEKRP